MVGQSGSRVWRQLRQLPVSSAASTRIHCSFRCAGADRSNRGMDRQDGNRSSPGCTQKIRSTGTLSGPDGYSSGSGKPPRQERPGPQFVGGQRHGDNVP
jgi:hypothetical protein